MKTMKTVLSYFYSPEELHSFISLQNVITKKNLKKQNLGLTKLN